MVEREHFAVVLLSTESSVCHTYDTFSLEVQYTPRVFPLISLMRTCFGNGRAQNTPKKRRKPHVLRVCVCVCLNHLLTGKAGAQLDDAVSKLKTQGEAGETIAQVQKTVKDLSSQATKLSSEYDLPAKAKQALGVAGELADTAIDKGIELEKEYKVTDKVKDAVKKSIDSAQK